jgi:hypothetical protein
MHPAIPEVPSGPSTPASEHAPGGGSGFALPNRSSSMSAASTRPGVQWSAEAERARQALTVRNPGPPTPGISTPGDMTPREGGGKFEQLGNIVRRMSSKEGHHKVGDAAKNF